ncbi:MAG: cell division protein ZipA, partial [Gammaproteobacteria bacterium]
GLPEDDWGSEEEQDRLVDDYENEPMPLQGAFDKAASTLDKVASQAANQLDKVATQAASQLDKVASQAATQLDRVANHAATQFDRAAAQAASHLKRPAREAEQRIEPGFGGDADAGQFDERAYSEDFSATWTDDDFDAVDAAAIDTVDSVDALESLVPRESARSQRMPSTREQGELFSETPAHDTNARAARPGRTRDGREGREGREESRLMAALQKAVPARAQQPAAEPVRAAPQPQEVIVINVMARQGQMLHGGDLLRVLQGQGMRLGDMSIFHRHADSCGTGPVMFSMANMVKPGTFDLAAMEDFATPGVSFFLQMPNKLGNMACFDKMLATASAVRDTFDAELKDEQRSVFTRQTVEHCRQRVRDFELKLLSRK